MKTPADIQQVIKALRDDAAGNKPATMTDLDRSVSILEQIANQKEPKVNITHLSLSWSTSRGRDTYGYNICRLDDRTTGKRYRCNGGGYDMVGTVFGDWLADTYQKELMQIKDRAHYRFGTGKPQESPENSLYGMSYDIQKERVSLDGACGIESMTRIAEAIGLEVHREYQKTGRNRGQTLGYYVSKAGE